MQGNFVRNTIAASGLMFALGVAGPSVALAAPNADSSLVEEELFTADSATPSSGTDNVAGTTSDVDGPIANDGNADSDESNECISSDNEENATGESINDEECSPSLLADVRDAQTQVNNSLSAVATMPAVVLNAAAENSNGSASNPSDPSVSESDSETTAGIQESNSLTDTAQPQGRWVYDAKTKQTYYLNAAGQRVCWSQTLIGTDNKEHSYYFNGAGVMQTGWVTWKDGTRTFFAQNSNYIPEGAAFTGWVSTGGNTYYFDPDTKRAVRYSQNLKGRGAKYQNNNYDYYFDGSGRMRTGWVTWKDGTRTFFAQNSNYIPTGAAFTGWVTTGGKWYYFNQTNHRAVRYSQTLTGRDKKEHDYYFNGSGVMQTGVVTISGKASFYDANGIKATSSDTKWVTVGNDKYYLRNGSPVRWSQTIDGNNYYFDSAYKMYRGWLRLSSTGKWTYFDINTGIESEGKLGWSVIGGKYYFYTPGGNLTTWNQSAYISWGKIQSMTSKTKYLAAVDRDRCYVTIFNKQDGMWVPYDNWICSVGANSNPTPAGVWAIKGHAKYVLHKGSYGVWYWSHFGPDWEGFHSVLTYPDSMTVKYAGLGHHNSGGCVRNPMEKAKWMYNNLGYGTAVLVY